MTDEQAKVITQMREELEQECMTLQSEQDELYLKLQELEKSHDDVRKRKYESQGLHSALGRLLIQAGRLSEEENEEK